MAQRDVRAALEELGGKASSQELTAHLLEKGILTCSRDNAISIVSKGLNRMAGWGEVERTADGKWQLSTPSRAKKTVRKSSGIDVNRD